MKLSEEKRPKRLKFKFKVRKWITKQECHNWKWTFVAIRRGFDRSKVGVGTSQCLFIRWNPNKNLFDCGSSKLFQSSSSDIICWLKFTIVTRVWTRHWFHSFSRKHFLVFSFWEKNFMHHVARIESSRWRICSLKRDQVINWQMYLFEKKNGTIVNRGNVWLWSILFEINKGVWELSLIVKG